MKDRDLIERIREIYDEKEPDVLSKLDFANIEMAEMPEQKMGKRYMSAIAVYAAACVALTVAIPFIIGGREDPKPEPPSTAPNFETIITGERAIDRTDFTEYEPETEDTDNAETLFDESEVDVTVPEETVPDTYEPTPEPETVYTPVPDPEPETVAPAVQPEETTTTTAAPQTEATTTTTVTTVTEPVVTEPEDPTPENMVEDKIDIPFTLIRYSGGWSDSLTSLLECDRILQEYGYSDEEVRNLGINQTWPVGDETYIHVIKTKEQFDALAAQITDGLEADLINEGAFAEFAKDFEYFDEEYFEKYELVFWGFGETVHGIEYQINNFEVDNNAVDGRHNFFVDDEYHDDEFWVNIVKKLPPAGEVVPADIAAENKTTELVLIAFEKEDVESVQDEKRVYGTSTVYQGSAPEDGKTLTDLDKYYYQGPYKIDVTEEEALEKVKYQLIFAQGSNTYPYTDGDFLGLGDLSSMYDYKCELTEWNGFPMYDISFYSRSNSSGIMYKVTLQLYANERCQKSSIVRNRLNDPRDATAKRAPDYVVTERATPGIVWATRDNNTLDPNVFMPYTYYEYADSTSMAKLWAAADPENSEYSITYKNHLNGLPYLVFDNYEDYSDFIMSLTVTNDYEEGSEAYDFLKDSEKYDEEYFEDNILTIVGVMNKDNSVDNRMTVSMFDNDGERRVSVRVNSFIPGFEGGISDKYEFSEDDEIEYKMYVYEFSRQDDVTLNPTSASFYNYNSEDTGYYVPFEDRQKYYISKND